MNLLDTILDNHSKATRQAFTMDQLQNVANKMNDVKVLGDMAAFTNGFITAIEPTRNTSAVQSIAGHDFEAELAQINVNGQLIDDRFICLDKKTGQPLGNGVVSGSYVPTQPAELYEIADSLLKLDDSITITDFIKRDNNHFIGLQLNTGSWSPTHDSADMLQNNITLFTSFDGSKPTGTKTSSFRVICANTFAMAKMIHAIKHTKNSKYKLNDLRRLLGLNIKEIEQTNNHIQQLVNIKMNMSEARRWFENLLLKGKKRPTEGRALTILNNNLNEFERLLRYGAGAESGAGTRYAAWNALTNYTTHERTTRVSAGADESVTRWESNLFGSSSALAQDGFNQLVAI